ncbi:phage tail protein [Salmonella enterica]|nr:phage tail protein [Salmonella enterica]MCT6990530.1 phage tail protein [Salmonella enterica subsp. enterica serovar Give]MCT7108493.1 phage tail protein [Salmonella enterica subsp. enterica serovar Give]MCT7125112.1 phage tail protein [Salmonella enterica subsp. enterica serovar Pomona]MCT7129494.1 phage tail protein [Salmonella enterica subsp. enterica serovar Pomona]SUF50800.1 gp25 [Salmonella enterica]
MTGMTQEQITKNQQSIEKARKAGEQEKARALKDSAYVTRGPVTRSARRDDFFPGRSESMDARVQMRLGAVSFSIGLMAYNSLTRSAQWRWAEQQRVGQDDLLQYTGKPRRTVKLSGELHAGICDGLGFDELELLQSQADLAAPQLLVSAVGDVLGYWVVKSVESTGTSFLPGGGPRHATFSMELQHYADDIHNP